MGRYVALLRGINVGGNNLIKMTALKACFEEHGFAEVVTYIQSGNVLFSAAGAAGAIARRIEEALGAAFRYQASVVLRSRKQMADIVARAPGGFGADPARYRYDVIYLKAPLTAAAALPQVPVKDGVDRVTGGTGVLYASRLVSRASQSRISKLVSLPIYQSMTIRNWNTTTALLRLMDGAG
ncbi:MAG TPA: DUF1697 domain-containing protein [Kofleriaceae bacterium]|nr:DUF1697 domain-containing protein [Kofleriaceae bacterium]